MTIQTNTRLTTTNGQQSSNTLPISGTFALWQMLAAMMKYLRNIQQNNAELQKMWATALGGQDGIYARMFNLGIDAGKAQAQGIRDEAYGNIAQAAASGAAFVFSVGKYVSDTMPEVNGGKNAIEELQTQKTALLGGAPLKEQNPGLRIPDEENDNLHLDAEERLRGLANGAVPVENLRNPEEQELNDQAIAHAANDPDKQKEIIKHIDEETAEHRRKISQAQESFTQFTNGANMLNNALGGAGAAIGKLYQADETAKAALMSSSKDVVSQVQQQVAAQEQASERTGQDAISQAGSWAQAFASAASAQVHA